MVIGGYRLGPLLKQTWREIGADNVTTLAASGAYNFFFSLFPVLLFLAPLLSLVGNKQEMVAFVMGQLVSVLPPNQLAAIRPILNDVVFSPSAPGLVSVGLVLAAWSGSNIFGTLMGALNTAYDVAETRAWCRQQVIRLLALVVGGLIVLSSTVVVL
ncbi:MAG TPA: YhjD/YihY/BrkB family envelope integrity protein, partial [Gemmatimonadaceae bacterium]